MLGRALLFALLLAPAGVLNAEPGLLRVSPERIQERLVYEVSPAYPQARISGTVIFDAVIDEDGAVERLTLISGHPLLVKAACDAAKQRLYRPWSFNGLRVRVATLIRIPFNRERIAPRQRPRPRAIV